MKTLLLACVLIIVVVSCENDDPPARSPVAEQFLNEVVSIMEDNSINRKSIDWNDFKQRVFAKADGAKTIDDTYAAIAEALKLLGDNHSFLVKPAGGRISFNAVQCYVSNVLKPDVPNNIGYVKVNQFSGTTGADGVAFAQAIQDNIKAQDKAEIIGWIVDLRSNGGGNMWPMLSGIAPILGEGVVGYFLDPDGNESAWTIENGVSKSGGIAAVSIPNSYKLISPNPKVCVLLDNAVASSGEAIAISFVGRQKTKSFGSSTCGLSTANAGFQLSHDHNLVLTVSYMADRNKNKFGTAVIPDQFSDDDEIIGDAINWIEN